MKKTPTSGIETTSPRDRWPYVVAGICYAAFLLLSLLVQVRALAGFDAAAMAAKHLVANRVLDWIGEVTTVAVSAEASVVYGVVMAFVLWRKGLGVWSLAPLAFVPLVLVEFALKYVINQPEVPSLFHHDGSYPLTWLHTPGAFPSGHAMRTAFLCTFLAVLLSTLRRGAWRWISIALLLAVPVIGYSRTYMGDHWLSDVVGGILLGGGTAVLVGWQVATRLRRRQASAPRA